MPQADLTTTTVHASCVVFGHKGLLIVGASGSGKSSLALMLMALGAALVSDDQTKLTAHPEMNAVMARAPSPIRGIIEARGIGLLSAEAYDDCIVHAIVDLDKIEHQRLPLERKQRLLGYDIPLYHRSEGPYFAAALIQLLKGGRCA